MLISLFYSTTKILPQLASFPPELKIPNKTTALDFSGHLQHDPVHRVETKVIRSLSLTQAMTNFLNAEIF